MPPDGFVVAMRGRLIVVPGPKRRRRAMQVWLIVSRFGPDGLTLAISLAGAAGGGSAASRLVPRLTPCWGSASPHSRRARTSCSG